MPLPFKKSNTCKIKLNSNIEISDFESNINIFDINNFHSTINKNIQFSAKA
jgi:hypothetical protein